MNNIISFQDILRRSTPTVIGCKDYQEEKQLLERADDAIIKTGIEDLFLKESLEQYKKRKKEGEITKDHHGWLEHYLLTSRQAMRCSILKSLLQVSFRVLSKQLAMSGLYQSFCLCENLERIRVPSKSKLQDYCSWLPPEKMNEILAHFTAAMSNQEIAVEIGLENELDMTTGWVDSTCLKANIHFPVDWVLLKDASRTLLGSIEVIRKHGLYHRIGDTREFMSRVNSICMAMAAASRGKEGGKKERKKKLRELDALSKVIERHARRYRDLLDEQWQKTDLSRAGAEVILRRMDNVLAQLPEARRQARERIIGERQIKSKEKILSLYDPDIQVITRHKAGAVVEFGNSLFVVESVEGFIMDHELLQSTSPGDAQWLGGRLETLEELTERKLKALVGDRGFASQSNSLKLAEKGIQDLLCPRAPQKLREKLNQEEKYAGLLRRRAQTEGRIGILKNVFLEGTPRAKGFANRQLQVAWAVLAHNLWVVARLPRKKKKNEQEPIALAA